MPRILTIISNPNYPLAQVLVTPEQSGTPRPKVVDFLRPLFLSMVGRVTNKTPERGISSPDFARLLAPDHPHIADGQLPSKEQRAMSAKQNVIYLNQEHFELSAEKRWERELSGFILPLSDHEVKLVTELVEIVSRKPVLRTEPCTVLNFNRRQK